MVSARLRPEITKPGDLVDPGKRSNAMQNSVVETLIGAAVIAVAALFLSYAYTTTGSGAVSGYEVTAKFNRADGVYIGSDVRVSGIKVGTVSKLNLDPMTFNAVVTMSLANNVQLPDDSSVRITSEGLLGNQYLSIEPGGSQDKIKPGGEIEYTQGAVDLIGLLGKAVFSSTNSGSTGTQK
jgi:phospholipid/cholesterol/gamma-HCH transport system substrate-binding protein